MANKDTAIAKPLEPGELVAKIALTGNLASLSPDQQWEYYRHYCQYLGLDPITKPFDLLTTTERDGSKKTVLYANASCATQIADNRGVQYGKPQMEYNEPLGVLTISVEAKLPSGRSCWRRGVVAIRNLDGKSLENAIKKAETQAHRRATLALCGVAMPDESEVEDIAGAQTAAIAAPSTQSLEDRIDDLLRNAGSVTNETTRNFVIEWLKQGAYQALAEKLKCTADDLAREFGYLRQESQSAQTETKYHRHYRAHSKEAGRRVDGAIERLSKLGVKGRDLLTEVNSILQTDQQERLIESRYELTDEEVETVCEMLEAWAQKIEAKAQKGATL